jgi:hypothetical protein
MNLIDEEICQSEASKSNERFVLLKNKQKKLQQSILWILDVAITTSNEIRTEWARLRATAEYAEKQNLAPWARKFLGIPVDISSHLYKITTSEKKEMMIELKTKYLDEYIITLDQIDKALSQLFSFKKKIDSKKMLSSQ